MAIRKVCATLVFIDEISEPPMINRPIFLSFILILLLLIGHCSYAQKDSTYIRDYEQNLSIRTYFSQMFTAINYEDESGNDVDYMPNSPFNIGLGFSWKKIGFSASYGVNLSDNKNKGKTKALELQYHHYGRKVMFDLFLHKYKGFYIDNNDRRADVYIHRPDIGLLQLGFFGQYVFNGDKFSYNAAFAQNERQLKSAGSFQVGAGAYYNQVRADSTLSLNTELTSQTNINNVQIGVSVGYAHTWVIKKFYATVAIAVGCNVGLVDINSYKDNGVDIYPSVFPRFSFGYNAKSWSANVQFFTNLIYATHTKENKMSLITGNGQLTIIKRFNNPSK